MTEVLFRLLVRVEYYDSSVVTLLCDKSEDSRCSVLLQQIATREGCLILSLSDNSTDWTLASYCKSRELAWNIGQIYEIALTNVGRNYALWVDTTCVLEVERGFDDICIAYDYLAKSVHDVDSDHISCVLLDRSVDDVVDLYISIESVLYQLTVEDRRFKKLISNDIDDPATKRQKLQMVACEILIDCCMTPSRMHQIWLEHQILDGWCYGESFSLEKKSHPNLLPFEELAENIQLKDLIFHSVVRACARD